MKRPIFSSISPFLRGAFEALTVNGLGLIAALVSQSVLAQALGPAGFGIYSACTSIAAVLAVCAIAGMDTALLRELPKAPVLTRAFVRNAERGLLVGIILGLPIVYLWLGALPEAIASVLLALFFAASTIRQFALRANFIVFWGRFPDIVMRPVLVAGFVMWCGRWVTIHPATAISLHALAAAIVFLFGALLLKRRVAPSRLSTPLPKIRWKDRTLWLGLSLLAMLSLEVDKLIGSSMLTAIAFGHYALAARLFGFVIVATESLAVVAAPLASRMIHEKRPEDVYKLERDLGKVLLILVVIIFVCLQIFGQQCIAFLAPGFEDSVPLLKILSIAVLVPPLVLPRLAITAVLHPSRAWKLQSFSLVGLCIFAFFGAWFGAAIGLAWGIVAGGVLRAVIWLRCGDLVYLNGARGAAPQ